MTYGISRTVPMGFDEAVNRVTEELQKEGFGVLTSIDVKETLRKKLGVEFKKYVILGACNPPFAYRALQTEEDLGLLLPCNVVVAEQSAGTYVAAFDPKAIMALTELPEVEPIAREVAARLARVIGAMEVRSAPPAGTAAPGR